MKVVGEPMCEFGSVFSERILDLNLQVLERPKKCANEKWWPVEDNLE